MLPGRLRGTLPDPSAWNGPLGGRFGEPAAEVVHRPVDGRNVGRVVQPAADAGGVGQGEVADSVSGGGGADDGGEGGDGAEEGSDGEEADEEDDLGALGDDQLVEPGAAEGLFLGGRDSVAPGAGEAAGVAAGDGGEVDSAAEVGAGDSGGLEPGRRLARGAGEGTIGDGGRRPGAWPTRRMRGRGAWVRGRGRWGRIRASSRKPRR